MIKLRFLKLTVSFVLFSIYFSSHYLLAEDQQEIVKELKNGEQISFNGKSYHYSSKVYHRSFIDKNSKARDDTSRFGIGVRNTTQGNNSSENNNIVLLNDENEKIGVLTGDIIVKYNSGADLAQIANKFALHQKTNLKAVRLAIFSFHYSSLEELAELQKKLETEEKIKRVRIEIIENPAEAR